MGENETGQSPPDPFGPLALDMGTGALLAIFRGLRANGASLVEAACMTGAQVVLNGIICADCQQREPGNG